MTVATITPTLTYGNDGSTIKVVWETLTYTQLVAEESGDVGSPCPFPEWADRSIQVIGTFGSGGNVAIEGSCDGGTTWAVLNDPSSTALNVTTAKIEGVLENPLLIRPHVTAGDGTTDLDVVLFAQRPNEMRS